MGWTLRHTSRGPLLLHSTVSLYIHLRLDLLPSPYDSSSCSKLHKQTADRHKNWNPAKQTHYTQALSSIFTTVCWCFIYIRVKLLIRRTVYSQNLHRCRPKPMRFYFRSLEWVDEHINLGARTALCIMARSSWLYLTYHDPQSARPGYTLSTGAPQSVDTCTDRNGSSVLFFDHHKSL